MNGSATSRRLTRETIETRLYEDLERARDMHRKTRQQLQEVKNEIRSDCKSLNGTLRLHDATQQHDAALKVCQWALKRFTDFVVSGIVPDDLK